MGYDRVRLYDGSMGEWANRDHTPLMLESGD
jgi:3-mercaptopyruvate sulfurtransferase SseA